MQTRSPVTGRIERQGVRAVTDAMRRKAYGRCKKSSRNDGEYEDYFLLMRIVGGVRVEHDFLKPN